MGLALTRIFDTFENLLLRFFAEAFECLQPAGSARLFELIETADAELVVEDADFLETELGNTHQLEDAGGILFAQLVEIARFAGAEDYLDDRRCRFSDSGSFLQLAGGNQLPGIAIEC